MHFWLALIISLPTENATVRQRAWRALRACGAAVLRDGVYLMPERASCRKTLEAIASDVRNGGGTALVMRIEEPDDGGFPSMFDRTGDYSALLSAVAQARSSLSAETVQDASRQARRLRKALAELIEIDFFPGEAQRQADTALRDLETAAARALSPDEPRAADGSIARRKPSEYRGRVWATRRRPWVDRLASAWLIQRRIDRKARFLWLEHPGDCPADALGFDFDGATFSHVGSRVSFEVLLACFGLEDAALTRLGQLVHYLDVGGVQPPEAAGVECVLAGLRETISDDDRLLASSLGVFDGLLAAFEKGGSTQ